MILLLTSAVQSHHDCCYTAAAQLGELQRQLDDLHSSTFSGVEFLSSNRGSDSGAEADAPSTQRFDGMTEADFAALGRDDPAARKALLAAKVAADAKSVQRFQSAVVPLRLQRTRLQSEIEALQTAVEQARADARAAAALEGTAKAAWKFTCQSTALVQPCACRAAPLVAVGCLRCS